MRMDEFITQILGGLPVEIKEVELELNLFLENGVVCVSQDITGNKVIFSVKRKK